MKKYPKENESNCIDKINEAKILPQVYRSWKQRQMQQAILGANSYYYAVSEDLYKDRPCSFPVNTVKKKKKLFQ